MLHTGNSEDVSGTHYSLEHALEAYYMRAGVQV